MALTPNKQLAGWVAGRPRCPNTRGECCPDFSCCQPSLLWPAEKRRAFAASPQSVRERMMVGALADVLESDGHAVTNRRRDK